MAWSRHRVAIWACAFAAVTLAIGIGVATGAKLKTKSNTESLSPDEFDSVTAKCKKGTKAVSGGFDTDTDDALDSPFVLPYMSRAEGGRKWTSAAFDTVSPGELTSFAYCRDQKVKRRSEDTSVAGDDTESVTARCPRGTKVLSGGFDNPNFGPDEFSAVVPSESLKTGKREWSVTATNLSSGSGELVAQVTCHEGKGLKTVQDELSITSPGAHDVDARCGGSRRVVSGGFEYSVQLDTDSFVFASHKVGKREWLVEAIDFEDPGTLTVYAYCEKKNA